MKKTNRHGKQQLKHLVLEKETLRALSDHEIVQVAGNAVISTGSDCSMPWCSRV